MATNRIKGLTVEIGGDTTKLGKALEDVNKKSRDLSSELGSINKLLKLDPSNVELLAQKQQVLTEAISATEDKLGTLREAEKQVQAQFERGEVSEAQYRELQREIIATENKLTSYKKEAEETADAVERLGEGSDDAAKSINKEAQAADDAADATDDLGGSLADAAKTGFKALATAAAAAVASLVAAAETSREYRTAMGKLNTAFQDNNHSAEAAAKTYEELQGLLGDTDQAVEAANHLAKLTDNEEDLAKWTNIAAGVYATFGDSLPIENLTEAANETAKTGKITGGLADALNWAGESEDDFQEALDKCTNEQERQALITETLNGLYKNAAAHYKATNKEVIRANQATEKWNKALAKVGKYVEPVVTDIKEMGAALLEDAADPLKDIADFIRSKVLPAITSLSNWVRANGPKITALLAGSAAALVSYKVATLTAELATKGITVATIAQTVAQKALNLAMAATPWGLVATAITGVVVGLTAFFAATESAKERVDMLTESERELIAAAGETAQAFRDQKDATEENIGGITSQMGHVQALADELDGLVDANGRVAEADRSRVDFILGELNSALGTEYSQVDGVIQQYGELRDNIDAVIKSKTANALLEASNADYISAIQAEGAAWESLQLVQKDYEAQLSITKRKEDEYLAAKDVFNKRLADGYYENNQAQMDADADRLFNMEQTLKEEQALLDEKKAALDQSAADYGVYQNTINTYEEAQTAALEGNTQRVIDLLTEKGNAHAVYSDKVDDETAKALDALKREAVEAGIEAKRIKKNFEDGVVGYTEEMVKEAEKGYQDAMDEFATAYADAESVGEDLGKGLSAGMDNKRSSLFSKARSLVSGIISAMRKEADSHSPARKTIDFGEDLGEGAEVGIDNKTRDVKHAATRQAEAILDAYNAQETEGQQALRNVADQQATRAATAQNVAMATQGDRLDKILAAIERGQILTIDGYTLVGATAGKMDNILGQRRALVARGAL